jgi:hypothetical protein
MDFKRLRLGEWMAAFGAVALIGFTRVNWYFDATRQEISDGLVRTGDYLTAWEAFAVVDLLLGLLIVAGIAVAALCATRRSPALPVAAAILTTALGIVVTVLVIYRLLNQPGPNDAVEVLTGAWLGLAATVAVTAGAWIVLGDERTDASEPPHVPARPAPPETAEVGSDVARGVAPEAARPGPS